jgi:Uma2 family endonuclease
MTDMDIKLLTADDLLKLPMGFGQRYELIEGVLVEMSPAGFEHGVVAAIIIYFLTAYAKQTRFGVVLSSETGYRTRKDDKTVRAPDASFMSYTKIPADKKPRNYSDIAPDLVVEVVSPNDSAAEIEAKTQEWLDFGVSMVWVAYPGSNRLHIHRAGQDIKVLSEHDSVDSGDVLPGFSVRVVQFFED